MSATSENSSPGAFFYGTLLHPKVLKRVIQNDGDHLSICPAILLEHTRHRIKGEDYPGVLPYASSRNIFDYELSAEERSVRGTLVYGLRREDLRLLDDFEGDEYDRALVSVHPLHQSSPLNSAPMDLIPSTPTPLEQVTLLPAVLAYTYIWIASSDRCVPELWSYGRFVKDNAWKWTGESDSTDSNESNSSDTLNNDGDTIEESAGGSKYFSDQVERRKRIFGRTLDNTSQETHDIS